MGITFRGQSQKAISNPANDCASAARGDNKAVWTAIGCNWFPWPPGQSLLTLPSAPPDLLPLLLPGAAKTARTDNGGGRVPSNKPWPPTPAPAAERPFETSAEFTDQEITVRHGRAVSGPSKT